MIEHGPQTPSRRFIPRDGLPIPEVARRHHLSSDIRSQRGPAALVNPKGRASLARIRSDRLGRTKRYPHRQRL
ncbi:hypothetical protein EFD55_17175 [Rhizobium pisi]|uniref:Uncharacterized protein n=1 Tax=Rhizobium pisi TaxID=574561 RepID=A0A427MYA3_9HYPH|nr:hypothetical protein EFD55_17175 [Rhizobium pisi]TCA58988.1 hypothetical protein E0J16_11545 [Rhizobium pisi]